VHNRLLVIFPGQMILASEPWRAYSYATGIDVINNVVITDNREVVARGIDVVCADLLHGVFAIGLHFHLGLIIAWDIKAIEEQMMIPIRSLMLMPESKYMVFGQLLTRIEIADRSKHT
jgi:hypothetical protein